MNYFLIDNRVYLTDLPGYGYAKVSKEERDRWGRLMESYFQEPGLISWVFSLWTPGTSPRRTT